MPEPIETQSPGAAAAPPPLPNPEPLKPTGLSNAHKRYLYYGITAALTFLIVANLVGTKQESPAKQPKPAAPGQQQNPTAAQIRDWENNLKQAEAQLEQQAKERQSQLDAARSLEQTNPPQTADDLQRAEALHEAALARQQYQQNYGNGAGANGAPSQQSQIAAEQEQHAYKSLFADNVVRQESARAANPDIPKESAALSSPAPSATTPPTSLTPVREENPEQRRNRKPLDFDPDAQPTVWLPEGTVLEAALTNRLDGDAVGPVDCQITTDVFQPGTRVLLIPRGARVLGEASQVSSLGQSRLAVAFHRILVPGLAPYSIPLDKPEPGLGQAGDVGLQGKVNNHYASIFGSSLAIGAIGGLAQIGNGYSGFGYDPSVQLRNGISQSMAQSSARILDRFLNRLPTITIREGTRVKILLTEDLQLPPYHSMRKGDSHGSTN